MADEFKSILLEHIKTKRRNSTPRVNKSQLKSKSTLWLYPQAVENKYVRYQKQELMKPLEQIVKQHMLNYNDWKSESSIFEDSKIKLDVYTDEMKEFLKEMNLEMVDKFGTELEDNEDSSVYDELLIISAGVNLFNSKQWKKQTTKVLGYPFETDEHWWSDVQSQWADENYNLLRRYETDYISNVNEIVGRGVSNGTPFSEVAKQIQKANNTRLNKAKLLSRDQIGKLSGLITQRRQVESGINVYEWRTMKDEKVRGNPAGLYPNAIPTHWIMEGMICKWDDDSVYANPAIDIERDENNKIIKIHWQLRTADMATGIPGSEILCRCMGVTYWDVLVAEAESQLSEVV